MSDNHRQGREEAKLKAHLLAERAYEKKMEDIDWRYDKFFPLMDDYKAGRLILDGKNPFQIEASEVEGEAKEVE